jgi:hypothetical protein
MKLVVTGTPGDSSCSRSRSATCWASEASEQKRRQSSSAVGLGMAVVVRGGTTSARSV